MGTHIRVISESYLMNTNRTGFRYVIKNLCVLALRPEIALALEGLKKDGNLTLDVCRNVLG